MRASISTESAPHTAVPFGQYLLLKRLAVGGMAELYLAKDQRKDKLVVIKRILPYLAQEREFVQMFLDEARIASQLHHPHIITVYELGHLEGSIFIAMEYVEGVDLRKIFNEEQKRGNVVPPNITAWLVSRLCEGLHYAHNRLGPDGKPMGIIHRDVSPQNLMVGYSGDVKLVDFGIAKATAFMERSKPGVIKGKFLYLAPEQLSQERIDHRADIFALGTMMYEVSTGKSPFYKATTEAVIYAIRSEEPPPPHLSRRDFPMPLSKIIMRCLIKDRTRRYQQAGEVHADIEAWLKSEARTRLEDVRAYVHRVFGNDEERTALFIPANAMSAADRMTDRVAAMSKGTTPQRPNPDRTVKGPPPTKPNNDETTKPEVPPLADLPSPSAVTSPVGRRPTPPPMVAQQGQLKTESLRSNPAINVPGAVRGNPSARSLPQVEAARGPSVSAKALPKVEAPTRGSPSVKALPQISAPGQSNAALKPVPAERGRSSPTLKPYAASPGSEAHTNTQSARPQDLARAFNAGGVGEPTVPLSDVPRRTSEAMAKPPVARGSGIGLKKAGDSDPHLDATSLDPVGRPPVQRASANGMKVAGASDPQLDPTALSDSGRNIISDLLPSLTPITADAIPMRSAPPVAAELRVARPSTQRLPPPVMSPPEGIRATRVPPQAQAVPEPARVARPVPAGPMRVASPLTSDRPREAPAAPEQMRVAKPMTAERPREVAPRQMTAERPRENAPRQMTAERPREAAPPPQQPRRAARPVESGAVHDVPQQYARDEMPRRGAPPASGVPTLPPEPATKGERPSTRGYGNGNGHPPSQDDIGPLLDQAIPSLGGLREGATVDPEDNKSTMDRPGIGSQSVPMERERPNRASRREAVEQDDAPGGLAQRPWLVAGIVFVGVLALGFGGLAVYRARAGHTTTPPIATTPKKKVAPTPPPIEKVAEKKDADATPPVKPVETVAKTEPGPPVPTVAEVISVKVVAPAATRLVDQRDNGILTPNTVYRWQPGHHPIIYRCPKKGHLERPDVTFNIDVKAGTPEQTFSISCK